MKIKVVIVVVLAILIGCGAWVFFSNKNGGEAQLPAGIQEQQDSGISELQDASVNVIKANLNLYYVNTGNYPFSIDELTKEIKHNPDNLYAEADVDTLNRAFNNLKEFNYSPRGDAQAYKFTYEDYAGQQIIVEGNYLNDYQ